VHLSTSPGFEYKVLQRKDFEFHLNPMDAGLGTHLIGDCLTSDTEGATFHQTQIKEILTHF
jgi:hypothetical protein